jgi:hypothetical protein
MAVKFCQILKIKPGNTSACFPLFKNRGISPKIYTLFPCGDNRPNSQNPALAGYSFKKNISYSKSVFLMF